jgi:hypothetical protein
MGAIPMCLGTIIIRQYPSNTNYLLYIFRLATCFDHTGPSSGLHPHHHHHISAMQLGHLLTRSGLTLPEVSSKVCHDSFCQLGNIVSLPWVIYYGAFYSSNVGNFNILVPRWKVTKAIPKSRGSGGCAQRVSTMFGAGSIFVLILIC